MRLIAKSPKTQPLHSPFADNIYHFWRLSKKYPHLFFHPLENQGKWEENAWFYDVADCIYKLKNALRTSLKTPPKRPVDTIKGRKTWFWHQRRGHILGRSDPLPIAFTGLSVVNSLYTAIPKRTSLVSYFVQSQFVISTKNLRYVSSPMISARAISPFGLLVKTVEKRTETIEDSGGKAPSRGLYGLAS